MAKILVIGAHGKIGQLLVKELDQAGHKVVAGFRKEDQLSTVTGLKNVEPILSDLDQTPEEMAAVMTKNDVKRVVFTAGAGGKGGVERTMAVDLDGAIKSMQAARQANISRYIMVSAAGADDRKRWVASNLYWYFMAKHYADLYLKNSGLPYTIVRPTALLDEPASGKGSLLVDFEKGPLSISRADVSRFLFSVLKNPEAIGEVYDLTSGDQPIDQLI
ncbi:NAD-dependent epimerase/dehydratase [Fructobacillus pseudoficulneus]|uniref:NAD-dependent epimerase/dehydratase n=1 Tax=Fructobacillus pseudoficulneus TaxID=220714 RepID=A0A3F3H513_9LACO|nr:SDR family oxidoreductase [Fructobacillus pseudoficulneus]GAP02139.1 NAD-dependent epimerase/dehydratase [Fructobacillus pseudoficulneus]SEH35864.1 Uncharacterized conserved protein YbjT, contains NAD(P)-binding and DUF2867 domains [Fructobacillus pseudoficulneus]